jgi:hypothetical protein
VSDIEVPRIADTVRGLPPHPRCALPVVRLGIDEEQDEWVTTVEVCGEQLYLERFDSGWIDWDGPGGPDSESWKLTCLGGHVLLVPDDQGNDHEVPFRWDEAVKAIGHLLLASPEAEALAALNDGSPDA